MQHFSHVSCETVVSAVLQDHHRSPSANGHLCVLNAVLSASNRWHMCHIQDSPTDGGDTMVQCTYTTVPVLQHTYNSVKRFLIDAIRRVSVDGLGRYKCYSSGLRIVLPRN